MPVAIPVAALSGSKWENSDIPREDKGQEAKESDTNVSSHKRRVSD